MPHLRQIWTSTRRRAHHTAWPFLATAQASANASGVLSVPEPLSPDGTGMGSTATRVSSPALNVKVVEKPQMAEINPGIWDGLSPDQARKYYPADWERFAKDPYAFRAPRAESYHDLSSELSSIYIFFRL